VPALVACANNIQKRAYSSNGEVIAIDVNNIAVRCTYRSDSHMTRHQRIWNACKLAVPKVDIRATDLACNRLKDSLALA
jgi:hypothetical protein